MGHYAKWCRVGQSSRGGFSGQQTRGGSSGGWQQRNNVGSGGQKKSFGGKHVNAVQQSYPPPPSQSKSAKN